jgi:hypothetical protein
MKRHESNWIMRDCAASDPRSAKAMLEGRDDGRAAAYDRYREEALGRNPNMSEEQLMEAYPAYVRLTEQKRAWREGTLDRTFQGYSKTFLAAVRAHEDSNNALNQSVDCHPGEIYDRGFDATMTLLGGGLVFAVIFWCAWQTLS